MRERNGLKKTRESGQVPDQTFILHFFLDVERHVCCKRIAPVVGRYDKRNHSAHKSVLKFEVIAHFRSEKRMAELHNRPTGKQIHAASLEFARTRPSEYVLTGIAVSFYETMHNRENGADALNFADNDSMYIRRSIHKLGKPLRIGLKPRLQIFAQKVNEQRIGICVAKPS